MLPTHPLKDGHMSGGQYRWLQVTQRCGSVQKLSPGVSFSGTSVHFLIRAISHVYSLVKRGGMKLSASGQTDVAIKSQFCLQRGKRDWRILGATEVLCPRGFHLCDRNPFPMLQNKIKSQLIDLSRGNSHNSDIKFVPVVPSKDPFIGFEQVI